MSTQPTLRPEHVLALRKLLDELETHHTQHLTLLIEHRRAIGLADQGLLAECVHRQQSAALALSQIEHNRAALLRQIAGPKAPPMTLTQLARLAGATHAPALLAQALRVRTLMATCIQKQTVLASASSSLLGHVHTLVRQIARNLSETGAYARGAVVNQGASSGTVDLVS